jgi:hypothetical protein
MPIQTKHSKFGAKIGAGVGRATGLNEKKSSESAMTMDMIRNSTTIIKSVSTRISS